MSALVLVLYAFRLSLYRRPVMRMAYAIGYALCVYAIYPWSARQSMPYWEANLTQVPYIEFIAFLLIIDACILIGGCLQITRNTFHLSPTKKKPFLHYIPMLSPALALAYLQGKALYWIDNQPFYAIALAVLGFGLLGITLSVLVLKVFVRQWDIRLEWTLILAFTLLIVGTILTNRYPYATLPMPLPADMLRMSLFLSLVIAAGTSIGYVYARYPIFKRSNYARKWNG